MKVIKKFWAPIFIVCFLLLGYVIGQVRNSVKAGQELATEVTDESETSSQTEVVNNTTQESENSSNDDIDDWQELNVLFENSVDTADNPWGYTAGLIDVDDIGKCALLTPNTSFTLSGFDSNALISLQAELHPWVAEESDGAGIVVWIMDENGEILKEDTVDINNGDSWVDIKYSIDEFENASQIKFLCNNGKNNDDACDWVIFRIETSYESSFGNDDYVRSVTYFGDVWPINFWNSELENLDEDFTQIVNDGFNSIIVCIPWKEFQTSVNPIGYSTYTFDNLDKVMRCAEKHGLDVYARIGYTWDYYNDENEFITERYLDILRTDKTHEAWLDYCKKVYDAMSQYSNFRDGFITWEDFWGCLAICDNTDELIRKEYAGSIGYRDWVNSNYKLDDYNEKYGCNFSTAEDITVPLRNDPAMEAFYSFYDEYLSGILRESQEVFPNLSMEVRMDWDGYEGIDGNPAYYDHSATYKCEESDYTATMYGIPMGFENKGERVSADDALNHTDYILGNLYSQNDGKPIYVEQFLFMDNTPQFSYNAQIKDNEVGKYLEDVSDVLLKYTKGYGIWTYKDYKNNMIYNSQFAIGEQGWNLIGTPIIEKNAVNDNWACFLDESDGISQEIPMIRNHFQSDEYTFEFDVVEDSNAELNVKMGDISKSITVTDAGNYSMSFPANSSFDIEISVNSGSVVIDDMCLYSFVQEGHLYDSDNEEMEHIKSIRVLNEELDKAG